MYNSIQIRKLMISAVLYGLDASDVFWRSPLKSLTYVCNGCGPECMSKSQRSHLTHTLSRYAPAFAIHDTDYDTHEVTRKAADKRMRRNMVKIWRKDFGFWRWLSFAGIFNRVIVIPGVYSAVRQYGEHAWKSTKRILKYENSVDAYTMCSVPNRVPARRQTTGTQRKGSFGNH